VSYKIYFDPGGPCAGWALFLGDRLVECGLSRTKAKTPFLRAQAHRAALQAVWDERGLEPEEYACKSEAMWYRPVTYIDAKGKKRKKTVPPQDIIDVNLIAGHVGTEWILPHDWKGMVSKEIHQPKILQCLSAEELKLVEAVKPPSLRHNCIDAIGIGLHDNERLEDKCNNEASQQVRQLLKLSFEGSESTPQPVSVSKQRTTKRRGSVRPKPPSHITLPKGSLKLGPMARATASRAA
jgi:hypothetical protein